MSESRNSANTNAKNDEQLREHTGLRTLTHASTKERLQARASGERVRQSGHSATTGDDATAAGDRSGERGVSL